MNLYIYYEVVAADASSIAQAVRTMQASLGMDASDCRLLRRAESRGDRQTWMEIYENVPEDFEARLAASVDSHGLAEGTGVRHVERFVTVD